MGQIFIILFSIVMAMCLGYMALGFIVNLSNNVGDSKGTMKDFSEKGIELLEQKDKIEKKLRIKDFE